MNGKKTSTVKLIVDMHHDLIVTMQAAVIEWRHGKGSESAMEWIENTLDGPGLLPDPNEPYGKEAQFYMSANRSNPTPYCACGNPSHIVWMGRGFCSEEHYKEARRRVSID